MTNPLPMRWDGESLSPINQTFAKKADAQFVVGEVYFVETVEQRSAVTHRHYFASLHDIWLSLPERMHEQFPSSEALRKYALIRTGYHTQTQHVAKSNAEAERLAAAIRPYDTYQLVTTKDSVVTVYHAISQDMRSMDKKTFAESKQAVLDWCSDLIGVKERAAA